MPAGAAGTQENAQWGYKPSTTSVIKFAGTSIGAVKGDITVSIPRQYAFGQLDQGLVEFAYTLLKKELTVSLAWEEMLLANLQYAWDNDAAAAGPPAVLTLDDDVGAAFTLLITTFPPNNDGNDTRALNLPTAISITEAPYTIADARGGAFSSQACTFKAIGDSSQLLATLTDTYNA